MGKQQKIISFDKLTSEDFYRLITEHGEAVSHNTAEFFFEKMKNYLDCRDTCMTKSSKLYLWMGFIPMRNKYIPTIYIASTALGVAGFIIGIYSLL